MLPTDSVAMRYRPPAEPEKPPDVVEVLLRRESAVMLNGIRLRLVEPPFRFYTDLLKRLFGGADAGLLTRLGKALQSLAKDGSKAEVESALLVALVGEAGDFVCEFLARLLTQANEPAVLASAGLDPDKLPAWLADNVPAAGMAGLVSAALYVCDVATLRGFFVQAAGQFRPRAKT